MRTERNMLETNIPQYSVIRYVRNKQRIPYGALVAVKTEDGFSIGYSLCCKKDKFFKQRALNIAIARAFLASSENSNYPHDIRKLLPDFIARCTKYYKVV
jgi:hypothetical protein